MQFLKNNWPYIILVFIVALSAIFRLWDLSSIPPGIYPDEAKNANDLRGEIFPTKTAGAGGLDQKEQTQYTGSHMIECFIIKRGACVARSGIFVVNIL
ncbi:MAG: hypothetical protein IID18_10625 [Nitrospinae bacterium]|nr:hypothetical protein [Nitrospinota bacterium]